MPPARPATGVARGSLGTGTAVDDDETKVYRLEELARDPEPTAPRHARIVDRQAVPPPSAAPQELEDRVSHRRRAIGDVPRERGFWISARTTAIALAGVLVVLLGIAVVTELGNTPAVVGSAPSASQSEATPETDSDDDDEGGGGDARGGGNGNDGRGNGGGPGNGNGRGNGNGGDNGRGND